jgi:hypothetical protein
MVKLLPNKVLYRALSVLLIVLITTPSWARYKNGNPACQENKVDSILIFKKALSKSYKISLYADASQQVIFFSVHGIPGKVYQLYLFDLDGKLVKQCEIRNKQTTHIKEIEKGVYLFDVFSDDDRIGNGQLTVR